MLSTTLENIAAHLTVHGRLKKQLFNGYRQLVDTLQECHQLSQLAIAACGDERYQSFFTLRDIDAWCEANNHLAHTPEQTIEKALAMTSAYTEIDIKWTNMRTKWSVDGVQVQSEYADKKDGQLTAFCLPTDRGTATLSERVAKARRLQNDLEHNRPVIEDKIAEINEQLSRCADCTQSFQAIIATHAEQ